MARFLSDADYNFQIRTEILSSITQDNYDALLPVAENASMQEIEGYLAQRYDMATVWIMTGPARNPLLVMYMVDIVLYHIYSSISNKQMPAKRENRYLAAKDYFERAAAGKVTLNLPRITDKARIPINIGATIEMTVTAPPTGTSSVNITVGGTALTASPITLAAGDAPTTAQAIVNAINLYANNTGFTAMNQLAGNFLISMPASLGHKGNFITPIIIVTGTVQVTGGTSHGGITHEVDTTLDPERMRIGSSGRKFRSESEFGP